MSRKLSRGWIVSSCLLVGLGATLGSSGCPVTGPPISLLHQEYSNVSQGAVFTACGAGVATCTFDCSATSGFWAPTGSFTCQQIVGGQDGFNLTFQPTAVGKTVTVTLTSSAVGIQFTPVVREGFSILAGAANSPMATPVTLNFVTKTTNVHTVSSSIPLGGTVGETFTIDVVQQP